MTDEELQEAKQKAEQMKRTINEWAEPIGHTDGGTIRIVDDFGNAEEIKIGPGELFMVERQTPNAPGRTQDHALAYVDPLECPDIIDDVLESEFVAHIAPPPCDPLDVEIKMEAHVAKCDDCIAFHGLQICSHCLEPRVCKPISMLTWRNVFVNLDGRIEPSPRPLVWIITLLLCKRCAQQTRGGALTLWTGE